MSSAAARGLEPASGPEPDRHVVEMRFVYAKS